MTYSERELEFPFAKNTSINSTEFPAEFQKFPRIPASNSEHKNYREPWYGRLRYYDLYRLRSHVVPARDYVRGEQTGFIYFVAYFDVEVVDIVIVDETIECFVIIIGC